MIRRATTHEIDAIEQIFMERFAWERKNGRQTGWIPGVYPSRSTIRRSISKGEMFALWDEKTEGKKIYGVMVFTQEQPEEFRGVLWRTRLAPKEVMTVRELCVSALRPREGLGTQMMHHAMTYATKKGFKTLRVNVAPGNKAGKAFLEKLGFERVCEKNMSFPGLPAPVEQTLYEVSLAK